ncbi:MAG: MarR family transcriptional regulator [Proteobacteria bacterium]|nr:MarR family transcriptional regulator [Pseudomonadota bacterium]
MQHLLGYNLAQACIPSFAIYEEAIGGPLQLRQVEFTILVLVSSNENVTQKSLSLALDIAAPNLTVILDRLDRRGLVRRVRSETDRRAQHVQLTAKGRTLTRKATQAAEQMEDALLGQLSRAEQAMLFELLQKVATFRKPRSTRSAREDTAA